MAATVSLCMTLINPVGEKRSSIKRRTKSLNIGHSLRPLSGVFILYVMKCFNHQLQFLKYTFLWFLLTCLISSWTSQDTNIAFFGMPKLYVWPSSPSTNIMSHEALRAPKALNKSNLLSLSFITENLPSAPPLLTHTLLTFLSEMTWRRSPAENTSQAVVPDEGNHQACLIWCLPRDSNVTADFRMETIRQCKNFNNEWKGNVWETRSYFKFTLQIRLIYF